MPNKNKPLSLKESVWRKQNVEKWKVIDAEGNTLETFRTKPTAIKWQRDHELWLNEFSVVSI